jgi:PAS domain S-box-containing protein
VLKPPAVSAEVEPGTCPDIGMKRTSLRILLLEAEATFAARVRDYLARVPSPRYEVAQAGDVPEALRRLGRETFDLLLLSLGSPAPEELHCIRALNQAAPHLPLVVLMDAEDDAWALEAVRAGAQDFAVKQGLEGRMLSRIIRYAIERKRAAAALQQSEEFFRLISENVTDLIAVIDRSGRRLYNSPSYRHSLGTHAGLEGTLSFEEIHPDDKERIRRVFQQTLATGVGQRAEYRLQLPDGSVRHIESQGSVIRDEAGEPCKVVVVSRDITERKRAMSQLEEAMAELHCAHEQLQATQAQLLQSERLETVSTFAGAIAHEVKNPLQTILLGAEFMKGMVPEGDATAAMVATEIENAARKADAVIRGLLEFAGYSKRDLTDQDLSTIVDHALRAVEVEVTARSLTLTTDLAQDLPKLRLDEKRMRHVFIGLFLNLIRVAQGGGSLGVRTCRRPFAAEDVSKERPAGSLKIGDDLVVAEIEVQRARPGGMWPGAGAVQESGTEMLHRGFLDLTVLKKVVELFGGMIQTGSRKEGGARATLMFRVPVPG